MTATQRLNAFFSCTLPKGKTKRNRRRIYDGKTNTPYMFDILTFYLERHLPGNLTGYFTWCELAQDWDGKGEFFAFFFVLCLWMFDVRLTGNGNFLKLNHVTLDAFLYGNLG